MKISYAITVCNELEEIQKLLKVLFNTKREEDEIVILLDKKNTTEETEQYLDNFYQLSKTSGYNYPTNVILYKNKFNNHFGDWKNLLKNACKGDYIFQIDADEIPNTYLIENLPEILESNPVQRNIKFSLENTEACLAIFEKEFTFEIGVLKEDFTEVILNLTGWDTQINYN